MSPDVINGLFEFAGSIALAMDIKILIKDKEIKGVYWPAKIFFMSWGLWNIYFYGYYDHAWSFWGGIAMTGCNAVWVYYAYKYTRKPAAYFRAITKIREKHGFRSQQ